METSVFSAQATPPPPLLSTTGSDPASSPASSFFSGGCSARSGSSTSSLASSPITRESIEIYGSTKTPLADVREECQDPDEAFETSDSSSAYFLGGLEKPQIRTSLEQFRLQDEHGHWNRRNSPVNLSARSSVRKQRSSDSPVQGLSPRFGSRFPSFGKNWMNKTGASPKLSIITQTAPVRSRESSAASSLLVSPALSAISKHESHLPPSPTRNAFDEGTDDFASPAPIQIGSANSEAENDRGQATTPLLPPMLLELASAQNTAVQSPLQSPTVADPPLLPVTPSPAGTPTHGLPSPPLSTKPSVTSFRGRSRTSTMVPSSDIPPMTISDGQNDMWSHHLGHANFTIFPEPYIPEAKDVDSYRQLRANWDQARTKYAQHLARTGEHYGTTSKIYSFTEEKWATVDAEWRQHNASMSAVLGPIIARISDGDTDLMETRASDLGMEKPITKVMVPRIDETSGKFPEMGDEDIVGPMTVARPRTTNMQHLVDPAPQIRAFKRRNFLRIFSDWLGRHRSKS